MPIFSSFPSVFLLSHERYCIARWRSSETHRRCWADASLINALAKP
jgi:hypothetical protein